MSKIKKKKLNRITNNFNRNRQGEKPKINLEYYKLDREEADGRGCIYEQK